MISKHIYQKFERQEPLRVTCQFCGDTFDWWKIGSIPIACAKKDCQKAKQAKFANDRSERMARLRSGDPGEKRAYIRRKEKKNKIILGDWPGMPTPAKLHECKVCGALTVNYRKCPSCLLDEPSGGMDEFELGPGW